MERIDPRTGVLHWIYFLSTILLIPTQSNGFTFSGFAPAPAPNHILWLNKPITDQSHDDLPRLKPSRREILGLLTWLPSFLVPPFPTAASDIEPVIANVPRPSYVTLPLEFTGSELLIYYRVDGSLFRAVADTGSPFLMIPGSCGENTRQKSGCYREQGIPSGLPDTYELFDGFEGNVEWRKARVELINATGNLISNGPLITFGVASESILGGPGGVFFGLIRDTDDWIRPSFLGQTSITSLQLDLRSPEIKTLTLSQSPLITAGKKNIIRLTDDLRRKYGDPVGHYTARATSVTVNGFPLVSEASKKPIYVIFDTGVTGMVVSRELFEERYSSARERREKSLWGHVDIVLETQSGETVVLSADKPLTTPFDPQQNWKRFRGHLIVIGLSFLDGHRITIDIDEQQAQVESKDGT
jgi:hypothetical protein